MHGSFELLTFDVYDYDSEEYMKYFWTSPEVDPVACVGKPLRPQFPIQQPPS